MRVKNQNEFFFLLSDPLLSVSSVSKQPSLVTLISIGFHITNMPAENVQYLLHVRKSHHDYFVKVISTQADDIYIYTLCISSYYLCTEVMVRLKCM